jgi:hypothetical protein
MTVSRRRVSRNSCASRNKSGPHRQFSFRQAAIFHRTPPPGTRSAAICGARTRRENFSRNQNRDTPRTYVIPERSRVGDVAPSISFPQPVTVPRDTPQSRGGRPKFRRAPVYGGRLAGRCPSGRQIGRILRAGVAASSSPFARPALQEPPVPRECGISGSCGRKGAEKRRLILRNTTIIRKPPTA